MKKPSLSRFARTLRDELLQAAVAWIQDTERKRPLTPDEASKLRAYLAELERRFNVKRPYWRKD